MVNTIDQDRIHSGAGASTSQGQNTNFPSSSSSARPALVLPLNTFRSSQIDAERLDQDLVDMLHEQLLRGTAYLSPRWTASLGPEIRAVLDLLIFRFSVWNKGSSPGASLLNLRYQNARPAPNAPATTPPVPPLSTPPDGPDALTLTQKALLLGGMVGLRYFWTRAGFMAAKLSWPERAPSSWQGRLWRLLSLGETGAKVAGVFNLVLFLYEGKYRTLLERLVGARLVPRDPNQPRAITFEYLNRQLVWQEVSNLALALLPYLNPRRIRNLLRDLWDWIRDHTWMGRAVVGGGGRAGGGGGGGDSAAVVPMEAAGAGSLRRRAGAGEGKGAGMEAAAEGPGASPQQPPQPHHHASHRCVVCLQSEAINPFVAVPCGHWFCYYCLRANLEADARFRCPECMTKVQGMMRATKPLPVEGRGEIG